MFRTIAARLLLAAGLLGGSAIAAQAQVVKIGVVAPLTGPGATWGIAMSQAAKIAAADANAKGGLNIAGVKRRVEVIDYDDQYKAGEAIAAYNRLTNQDAVKFLLTVSSGSALALKQNVEDDRVVSITAGISSKLIDDNTKYLFRVFGTPHDFLPAYIDWVKKTYGPRRLVILNPNDETGWDQSQLIERSFKTAGFQVVGNELFERTQKDFQPILTKIMGLNADLIDVASSPPATAGLIIRQARELGYKGLFMKTSANGPREIIDAAGSKDMVEGMICLLYLDGSKPGGYRRIADAYKKAIGQEPNEILAPYYDGVTVLLKAIEISGDPNDGAKVAAAFAKALPMKSIQGDELTLGHQQILTTFYVAVVHDGEAVVASKIK